MADGVHDDRVFRSYDFEYDAVGSLADPVQSGKFTLQWKELGGIQVHGEPLKSINNAPGNISVELVEFFGGGLE